jgi:hypothetical protein
MSDYVKASLNSAKSLLHALRSRPSFTDVSSSERARIQTVLASSPLTTEKLAEIAGMINQIGFADIDETLLLDFIGGLCMQPSGGMVQPGTSTHLQNWEALHNYLPQNIWDELKSGNCGPALDLLVRMGLQHPTEATSRAIAIVVLFGSDGFEKSMEMMNNQKLTFLKTIKQMLKDRRKTIAQATVIITLLPPSPKEIDVRHPALFKQWYGEGGVPMASPMSDIQLCQLKGSFRMREVRACSSQTPFAALQSTSNPFDMMQAGMQMMQQMQLALGGMPQSPAGSSQDPIQMNFRRSPHAPLPIRSAVRQPAAICDGAAMHVDTGDTTAFEVAPPAQVASAAAPSVAQAAVEGAPAAADEITKAVLDKMHAAKAAKDKAEAKTDAKAKGSKGTPKAKAKAKVIKAAKVLKDAKVLKKADAADKVPAMPKLGPMTAIKYLTCSIYACPTSKVWRVVEKSNTRKDYKVSWVEGKAAWGRVVAKCRELSA